MNLSRDFHLHEFLRSQTAARMGREIVPTPAEIEALTLLCLNVLQPLRDAIGVTITINSGLRPPWLNGLVGGSKSSQHVKGEAADIVAQGYTPLQLCQKIVDLHLPFQQCILEYASWTHVSIPPAGHEPKRVMLTAVSRNGRTVYLPGLVADA